MTDDDFLDQEPHDALAFADIEVCTFSRNRPRNADSVSASRR
jgi:hypothetical protein